MSEKILTQTEKIYTVEDYLNFKHNGSNKREFNNGKILDIGRFFTSSQS